MIRSIRELCSIYKLPQRCRTASRLDVQSHHPQEAIQDMFGPCHPCNPEETEWDYEGEPVAWREYTEEEMAERWRAYEAASEEWWRTGGIRFEPLGPVQWTCRVTWAHLGETADYVREGEGRWRQIAWTNGALPDAATPRQP